MDKRNFYQATYMQLVNKMLEKEMKAHIGYEKHSKDDKEFDNRCGRNGNYEKTVIDEEYRKLRVKVLRNRESEWSLY